MKSLNLKEENIIKSIRNLFRLKNELNYTVIKNMRNLFRQGKETKEIEDRSFFRPPTAKEMNFFMIL